MFYEKSIRTKDNDQDAIYMEPELGKTHNENSRSIFAVILSGLIKMDRDDLVVEWIRISKRPLPANISRGLLLRAIAYQLQEAQLGALKKAARERLHKIAAGSNDSSDVSSKLNLGTRLLREWHGETHEVVIEDAGVRYQGKLYRSLSEVAQVITGTKWSGPVFFGLRKRAK